MTISVVRAARGEMIGPGGLAPVRVLNAVPETLFSAAAQLAGLITSP